MSNLMLLVYALFNLTNPPNKYSYCSHFTDKETKATVIKLISNIIRIQVQVA